MPNIDLEIRTLEQNIRKIEREISEQKSQQYRENMYVDHYQNQEKQLQQSVDREQKKLDQTKQKIEKATIKVAELTKAAEELKGNDRTAGKKRKIIKLGEKE
jgi:chromosome segregation ATPase